MSAQMSLSEKLVAGLALAVLLGGFACGAFVRQIHMGQSSLSVIVNASAAYTNYEISRAHSPGPR